MKIRWRFWRNAALGTLCVLAAFAVYALIEQNMLVVRNLKFSHAQVPGEFNGTRIVFVTDIHHGPFLSRARVKELVERVNALKPDLILLGGDYVYKSDEYIEPCFEELAMLNAPMGVFGVLGDYDNRLGADKSRAAMNAAGITLLDNKVVRVTRSGRAIVLAGVEDFWEGAASTYPLMTKSAGSDFVLLVSHNPDYAMEIRPGLADLVLSGHTHGGQVTFFGKWAPFTQSAYGQMFRHGLVPIEETSVLVSSGVGTVYLPFRFFAVPEINVIEMSNGQVNSG